jgi:hypothetical protein
MYNNPNIFGETPPPEGERQNSYTGSYAEHVHIFGGSTLFFAGTLLFSAGSILSVLLAFNMFSIFTLGMLALPIIGLLFIYVDSKNKMMTEKTLTALTLVKAHTIIQLVIFCFIMGLVMLGLLILTLVLAFAGPVFAFVMAFVLAVTVAIFVCFLMFYYIALLRVIKSIREGLMTDRFVPLRGVTPFIVVSGIIIGFTLIGSLIGMMTVNSLDFNALSSELQNDESFAAIFGDAAWAEFFDELFAEMLEMPAQNIYILSLIISVVTSVGSIMLLVTLNQFAGSITHAGSARSMREDLSSKIWGSGL